MTLRGKVRPSGGRQVKVVFSGPDQEVLVAHTKSNGTFKAHWSAGDIGNYKVTAHAVAREARARLPQQGPPADLASG